MKKNKCKYLSFLMVIMILIQVILPTTVFADTSDSISVSNATGDIGVSEPTRGAEIMSMREKNAKTYEMSDGSYQCVVYAENIHYEDSRGTLQDIDNSIKNTTTKSGYSLTNTANSWHTYFADKLSQDNAVSLEKDNYSVSFSLPSLTLSSEGSSLREPITENNVKIATQLTSAEKAENPYYSNLAEDNRAVLYKDVLNNVDISYTVRTGHLKEDIIIKSASAPKEFEFKLNMVGVTPAEIDGKLVFNNTEGDTVFELAPMYMEDANGKYSEEITYSLSQDKEGYKLKITADPNFFMDSKTVYPVVIDPSIMVTGESDTYDTCIDQQYPTKNYYLSENLWTGGKSGTNAMRTYMRFDLPTNITSTSINSAYIRIKKREHETPTIKGYRIVNEWSSSGVTWNNQPGYNSSYATGAIALDSGAWYKLNATTIVKAWRAGTYSNYGFILKEPSETSTSQKTKFYSSDAPSPNKPELVISYTPPVYSITYNGNGNTSGTVPVSQSSTNGNTVTLRTNTGNLAKTGHTFAGWNTKADGSGTSYSAGQSITMPAKSFTLYAKWTKKSYTITYNGNGNTSGTVPSSQSANYAASVTLRTNSGSLAKTGYTFAGWNTKADGSGTSYSAGQSITMPANNLTLYAKWTAKTNTITYNGNGNTSGSVPASQSAKTGTTVTLRENSGNLVKTGYTFVGWNTKADGSGISYTEEQSVTMPTYNLTLYAEWSAKTYTITYNGNSNTSGSVPASQSAKTGTTVTLRENSGNLVKTGYTFVGWNTKADGSGISYTEEQSVTMPTYNLTLYAEWSAKTYTITYNGNSNTSGSVPASQSAKTGTTVTISTNSGGLVRTGYAFSGWYSIENGVETSYTAGQSITMPANNLTLYAKWTGNVVYNANGGSGTAPTTQTFIAGKSIIAKTNTFSKSGYDFLCWNTRTDGTGQDVYAGDTYTPSGNTTLYAKWRKVYTFNSRIYYDVSCQYSESELRSFYNNAVASFRNQYSINFVLGDIEPSPLLDGATNCSKDLCDNDCGALEDCNDEDGHHKSASRMTDLLQSSSEYTYRLVGHKLCRYNYEEERHKNIIGVGDTPGKDAITSTLQTEDLTRSIQHELSHNFGCSHKLCDLNDEVCVLKGNINKWCSACKTSIQNSLNS